LTVGEGSGDLVEAVGADPILAPFRDGLRRVARSSIRLRTDRSAARYLGESRVGGRPSAPADFEWPTRRVEMPAPSPGFLAVRPSVRILPPDGNSVFQFMAQIDLAAVAPSDVDRLLPGDGLLLFFYDEFYESDIDPEGGLKPTGWTMRDGQPEFYTREFGFDEVGQVRVIHVPSGIPLEPHDDGPFAPYALPFTASREWTLPTPDAYVIADPAAPAEELEGRLALPAEARAQLAELAYEQRLTADIDQMLGWADNGAHGPSLPPDFARGWASIPLADRLRETQDARLLLQLSSATYESVGISFGRTLYFYIRESDLRRGDFSRAWYDSD
jgi:hypothetical protein